MEIQPSTVSAPRDFSGMQDFAAILQQNFESLFDRSHEHNVQTTVPTADEGTPGSIVPVFDGAAYKLYVRFPEGWKSVTLS